MPSMDEVFAPAVAPQEAVVVKPQKGTGFSHAEIFSGPDDFDKSIQADAGVLGRTKAVARDVGGYAAGTVGQVSDMFTSLPGGLTRLFTFAAGHTAARSQGAELPEAAAFAKEFAHETAALPDEILTPYRKVAEAMGPQATQYYEKNGIGFMMDLFSKTVAEGSEKMGEKTGLPPEYFEAGVDALMTWAGWKGTKASFKHAVNARTQGLDVSKSPLNFPAGAAEAPRAVVPRENPDPENMIPIYEEGKLSGWGPKDGRPFRQQMPEIPEVAEAAARTKQRLADVRAALKDEPTVKYRRFQADEAMEQRAAPLIAEAEKNGRLTVTEAEAKGMPALSEEVSHILNEIPAHQRTAEQLIKLREYNRRAFATQKGSVDPQHLLWLFAGTAAGMGGWKVGEAVYNYFQENSSGSATSLAAGLLPMLPAIKGKSMKERLQAAERAEFGEALRKEGRVAALRKYGGPLAAGTAAGYVGAELYKMATGEKTPEEKPKPKSDKLQDLALGVGVAAAAGAVKLKGGNWAEGAVTRLATSIFPENRRMRFDYDGPEGINARRVAAGREPLEDSGPPMFKAQDAWANKSIRTYLNRHMGTKEDPLKDVEIPFGEGMKRWEEVTDALIKTDPAKAVMSQMDEGFREGVRSGKIPYSEPVWSMKDQTSQQRLGLATGDRSGYLESKALQDYLSHVGDYLRQRNYTPEQLQQVDLVRAVKETAAWDKEMAKKMEKAAAEETAGLPVYKEYPDGFKWVEVRSAATELPEGWRVVEVKHRLNEPTWDVVDASGARKGEGHTAAEATTAALAEHNRGRTQAALKREGDSMGHCVGGYCDYVEAGDSKIYSLRDGKGKSHVTIEVEPAKSRGEIKYDENGNPAGNVGGPPTGLPHIIQIKGKQNRAPVAEYQPYVQDFVQKGPDGKGGKWGEVGDLENTGLRPYVLEGGKTEYLTPDELKTRHAEVYPKQEGNADPRLLASIAAAGGVSAYLLSNPDAGSEIAAAGLLALPLRGVKKVAQGLDIAFGRSSTRLAHIDPALNRNVRDMEHAAAVAVSRASEKIQAFVAEAKKLPAADYTALQKAYMEGDPRSLTELIKGNPALVSGYREIRNFLDSIGDELRSFGRFSKGITEHLPRVVKDHKGLVESLGHTERTGLEKVMAEAEMKTLQRRGRKLTDVERSIIVNNFLFREPSSSYLPGFAKNRTIKMTDELQKFYYSMEEGLARYAHAAVEDVATARFFGKDLRTSADGGKKFTHVDNSIGALTDRAMREGRMTPEGAVEVQKILRARFGPGELAPADWIQDVRNVTGIGTLGQIGSGLVQTSESLFSLYHHDLRPTVEAVGMMLTGRGISPKEFGLATHVIEETIGKRPTGQALSAVLKANLLAPLDQFGMKANLTASFAKNRRLAQTPGGRAALEQKWGEAYGKDFPELVKQLQRGERGPLTESLLWGELSDIRPASRIEMTQLYNEHPNGRFMYQLKQFMLTQIDIIRRDSYDKIKSGKPREVAIGLKNLTVYATAMALATIPADAVKAWISGRDFDFTKIDYVENMARYFGLNRYTMDKVSDAPAKGALEYGESMAKPPVLSVAERLAKGVSDPKQLVPLVPLVGRPIYDRYFGGNDARAVVEAKRERLNLRNQRERADPELKERRLERLRRRAEKKAWKDAR